MATYFMNIDTLQYWNVEKGTWVNTKEEATDLGHGKVKIKPKNSCRVSGLVSELKLKKELA